ncbi:hypothetical protein DY000_02004694 [Brassica cretica]|uniref:Uncharacterized protein n=1 Tax=Brassica cretica TaxID=69181 RepID=A0ABQ7CIN8_BRACR|nr:hypothetical protein DY000_02004694 [Brassica cretica]
MVLMSFEFGVRGQAYGIAIKGDSQLVGKSRDMKSGEANRKRFNQVMDSAVWVTFVEVSSLFGLIKPVTESRARYGKDSGGGSKVGAD